MQGLGLSVHLEESRLLRQVRLWRDHNMLHQLTFGGTMLKAENHPPEWKMILAPAIGLNEESSWSQMYARLNILPGSLTRRLLYRTSTSWYEQEMAAWIMWTFAAPQRLLFRKSYIEWTKLLVHTNRKLTELSWIEKETYNEQGAADDQ